MLWFVGFGYKVFFDHKLFMIVIYINFLINLILKTEKIENMDEKKFKKINNTIFNTWIGVIIYSILGGYFIHLGFTADWADLWGRVILILLGIFLQIPLGYFKIYKLIIGEND
ncbi:MAG: hypothetical protein L6408_08275 [Nanoarchaeota archaeon]|nr:hypothetical protein [Nanoarchaeota archaeon]